MTSFVFVERSTAQDDNKPPKGFTALFNGMDLTGWYGQRDTNPYGLVELSRFQRAEMVVADHQDMLAHWSVENGELVNDGSGVFLSSEQDYRDFEFWIDYKTVASADSGIYLKACPQIQIWDTTEAGGKWNIGADKGSGGMWNNSPGAPGKDPLVLADKPFGEWNRLRMIQVGQRTSVWLNDELVVDHAIMENNHFHKGHPLPVTGPIWLQTHGGEIRWRNIFVREFGNEEANRFLAERETKGFETVFNGADFSGWSGPTDAYEIVDGALRCRPGQGGTIYTEGQYSNFTACIEFRLPEGGNNGLAIRYPGEGDTAYEGMCELQVLDNTSPNYSGLDERQYHGSAYGMVASERGYLRDVGKWNFQRVTVHGSTIVVELNGSIILNTDLSQVTDYMGDNPHPGKDRSSGHFGFAGHGDPVEFRNVRIKRDEPTGK